MAETIDEIKVDENVSFDYNDINGYNPLSQNVEEKEYTKANIKVSGAIPEISEPAFAAPTLGELDLSEGEEEENEDSVFGKQELNDLPPKEKQEASQQLVELVLQGYSALHDFGQKFAVISDQKLYEKQAKGELDLAMHIPISETQSVGVVDFVNDYNKEIIQTLSVDDDFKDSVRPVLERIALKKGYGLSDEQFLLMMFGKDIIAKTAGTISLKKQLSKTLEIVYQQYSKNQSPPPPQSVHAEVVPPNEDGDSMEIPVKEEPAK
tara:strand:+ start:2370 stop:3164 length:795 start_codon:yes stop_codon:yes gene_type:complete